MKGIGFKRIVASALAVCMTAMLLPETFLFAAAADSDAEKTVISFEALDSSCAEQSVPLGQDQDALVRDGLLILPSSLTARVLVPDEPQVEPGPGFGGPEIFDESAGGGGGTYAPVQPDAVPGVVSKAVEVPVTWPEVIDGQTAGVFVLEPLLPEEYVLGEGVSAPTITVTVADASPDPDTEAGKLLREFLDAWFPGTTPGGIPAAVLAMDEDALLNMIADYERVLAAAEEEGAGDDALAALMDALRAGIDGALAAIPKEGPAWLYELPMMDSIPAGAVELRYLDGSGTAFIYHSFAETTSFSPGQDYAFLNNQFDGGDAVSALGSGAILKATNEKNNSIIYMRRKYPGAEVDVYVDVIQKGRDFDNCLHGGLYKVPGTSPAEYRYFCWAGGAQDCGAYYAYTYKTAEIEARNVSAQLKDVTKQGSNSSADYTVILTYDTGKTVTLDPGGYTVAADASTGVITFKITDNDGKTITARFQGPAAIHYSDGGKSGVTGLPGTQYEWPKSSVTLAADTPTREGYAFTQWQDQNGDTYKSGGAITSLNSSLTLTAQWKDTQAPDFTCEQVEVKLGATQAEVADKVKPALTVTDNEPVDQCTVEVTMDDGATNIAGERQVTVTVTDKAGNRTERKVTVIVTASALALTTPTFDSAEKTLTAQLASPGEDTITETGLVWGIMTAPTTTLNNGKFKTTAPVTTAGGEIKTTPDITEGVNYYARAYAIAGGVTYYSEQVSFGIGAANYGTFNISNTSGSTFTVTRTGGVDGEQTVYFRTVNGSAVGGTHFTHQAGTLTFGQGETTKTITITENGVATAYNGQTATAYSNADRTYSVELYRVTGGGTLGTARASRVMTKDSNHTVDRGCYEKQKVEVTKQDNKVSNKKVNEPAYVDACTMERTYTEYLTYLKATADSYEMHLYAWVYEWKDAYAWLRFTTDGNTMVMKFDIGKDYNYQDWTSGWFPRAANNVENNILMVELGGDTLPADSKMGLGLVYQLSLSDSPIKVAIAATGGGDNDWTLGGCEQESVYYDSKEPQLLGVAPMPDSTYKVGDQFVVSLIFDEIVDSQNTGSGNLESIKVHTTWGDAAYTGGADTNVLYFTGTVKAGASGNLSITSVDNIGLVKDMCSANGAASSASSGTSTGSNVNSSQPNITVASQGVTDGVGTATVTVNENKAFTTSMRYVWSASETMPATGWVDVTAAELAAAKGGGLTLSTRQEPGSGNNGKWYLHVLASYETTGASTYQRAVVDFGTKESPKNPTPPALSLTASADNTSWATSRDITVTAANGETLDYHREGETGWKTINAAGGTVNVTENGTYTFRLRRGDDMVTEAVEVERIDTKAPSASVGALSEEGSVITPKAGVYTKIALPVTFSDNESGIASVEYAWTDSTGDPGSWQTLSDIASGSATLTYTATESAETAKYLHIRVTDNVGRTGAAVSPVSYTVIAQSALNGNAPKIALGEVPAKWINDSVTLTWTVTNTSRRHFKVTLPDGSVLEDTESGTVQVTENKSVTVKVEDLDYGGISTATAVVDCIDVTPPTVDVPAISAAWTKGAPTVTFTADDTQSGVGKAYYKIVKDDHTTVPTGLTEFIGADYTVTLDEASTPTPGEYYVYYKFCDQSPSDWETTGRDTNFTEGFAGPFKIDRAAPTVTVGAIGDGWYGTAQSVSLTSSDDHAGMASLQYAVTTTNSAPAPADLATLSPTGGSLTVGDEEDGIFYIYYKAVDNAGNETTGWSAPIKVNKQTPTLTVSGGELGNPVKTEQTLSVTSGFGISGGTVTVQKPDGSTETVSGSSCTVTAAGTYVFTATSDSGLTATRTVVICAVSFDGNGAAASPAAQLVVSGGNAVEPDKPTLAGHTFVNWEKGGAAYGFGSAVTADVGLTAKWTLNAPTVTLAADRDTAAYDNGEAVITLTATPSHEAGDDVTYTYEWFKDGTKIEGAGGRTYTLDSVDDSGTYKVEVTARCGHSLISEKVTSDTVEVSVTAARPEISAPPTVAPLTYGDELTDDRLTGGLASLNGEAVEGTFSWQRRGQHPAATEGTEYSVVFTPADQDNYNAVTFTVTVTVNKKTLTPSVAADQVPGGAYDGTLYSHESADGEIVLAGAVLGEEPTAHGQVEFVTRDVGENKPVNVRGITLDGNWGKNYELSTAELANAPTQAEVTPIELTVVWHFSNIGDGATDMNAGWDGIFYTGENVIITAEATGLVAGDECALTVGENGVRTDAGTYTAKITEFSNKNYKLPDDITREYTIHKAPVSFAVTGNEHTYDREAHTATVTQNEELSHTLTATASGGPVFTVTYGGAESQTNAGTYDIVVTLTDPDNFEFAGGGSSEKAGTLTIARAPVSFAIGAEVKPVHDWTQEVNEDPNPDGYVIAGDADPAVWNDFALTMTYDSLEHRANVRQDGGLEMGDLFSVSYRRVKDAAGDAVGTFRDAGTYEIWVTLTDDARNFMFAGEEPTARTLCVGTVTVKPYEVRVIWQNLTFVYHGHRMHPTVRVENAFLADEQPDEKEKQGFLKDPTTFHEDLMAYAVTDSANAGDYPVTVTLYGSEAGNYTVSNPTAAVVIQPAPVAFEVKNNEWLYHEDEEQDRDVILTAAWGEVTNAPDTVVGDSYPGAGTNITLRVLGVTAEDIQYRLADGTVVDNPTEVGTYQVWVRIPNANFRHASTAGGDFHNVGVLRIAENDHPATYTVTFDPGRDERGNRFTGVTVPEPMQNLIPTQEITLPPAPENAPAGYVFAGWSQGGALYQPNEEFYMVYSDVTFEARWTKEIFSIAGVVIDDTETPIPYVSVALMMGEYQMGLTTTEEDGTFHFNGLIPNTYNLVFTWNGVVKTYMVEITDKNVEGGTYTLPGYRLNTVVEVAPGSGSVVVDLDPIITDEEASELYGADERALVEENGGTVEFMMRVESSSATEGITEKLKDVQLSTDHIGMVLDMSLTKTVTRLNSDGTTAESTVTPIDDSKVLIANLIYLPAELQGKDGYIVYRFHDENGDGENEVQTITTSANSDGERVEIVKDGTAIMVYARYYSTYVLTWYQNPLGRVDVADTLHGTVTSDYPSADFGVKVTLTVKPDEGYETDGLTVTDIWGHEVPVTDNGDGTYSFIMPGGDVTVEAAFRSKGCDGGEDCPSRRFTDLNVEAWYHEYTDYVIAHELMRGMGGTIFAPDGTVTRAQMVMVLWNLAGGGIVNYRMTYEDVEEGTWYAEAVRWAASEGIVKGYNAAWFGPDDPITREQMATMLYRYEQKLGDGGFSGDWMFRLPFADAGEVGDWAYEAVAWCSENGVIEGRDGNVFDPASSARRSEMAAVFTRYLTQER